MSDTVCPICEYPVTVIPGRTLANGTREDDVRLCACDPSGGHVTD
ncbi:hypothetical protein SEA_ZIRINKA_30 [Gordonia phage Zirinka]|uniref:Uncharacterized protein n=2 Tax=Nymphadoravirus zirinka TaxID=2170042 RepID=A0A1B3B1Y4_9CAUD|nr:hypothetical protein SEA_ZIRINKA_30 [Gordonia phage Zirinka]AOE45032.1 hypothetical protein SEA_ZIRINKA_30 [Gordonia phage Zirinka]AYQ99172.1 hypothetical protein PBI_BIALOTA_30 [Gordonia phage Bialota]